MYQASSTKTYNSKMPLWGNRKRITWKNNNTPRSCPQYQKTCNFYRNNNPRLSEKLLGFYELLKADKQIKITGELLDNYKPINAALAEACGLALRQPITGPQYVLMTNASFRVSGYALMIEENNEKKRYYKKMTFATLTLRSKVLSAQLKMPTFCKKFLAINHASIEYSHILWETTLPTLVKTDNRSVTRFVQTKGNPPTLWNACSYVVNFNFHILHLLGRRTQQQTFSHEKN